MTESNASSRKPLMAANWKMNKSIAETEDFLKVLLKSVPKDLSRDVVICPPFTALQAAGKLIKGTSISLGAQNFNENKPGAFTGEIDVEMLKEVGCSYVIIGHSERRQYQNESDHLVNIKTIKALAAGLTPIVCVGEKLEEREANKTMDVVSKQVKGALKNIPSADLIKLVLAYEPVWAIGTGKTATREQAQAVHLGIRDILKDAYGSMNSLVVRILYGGSVKPENINELMACEDIDGGLVGGASLQAESFLKLVNFEAISLAEK